MRVSVSERTGNAKTPKNIVTSDEEETLDNVRTLKAKKVNLTPCPTTLQKNKIYV